MDLAQLKFVVDTSDLKNAATEIERLGTAVNKLNKPLQEATTVSKKLNKEQDNIADSSKKVESATKKSVTVLERQQMILEFMTQGFSKGQSSQLAYAKAAGAVTDEIQQLGKVLQTQRTLMGTDPFDKSLGAMQALKNEYTVIKEVQRLYNAELGLSKTQMEDLAREKLRLIEKFKLEGASLSQIKQGLKDLEKAYVGNANAENSITESIKARQKAIQDTAKAQNYVAAEFERVNRLTAENGNITSATNNKIIAMEKALRMSGMSAAEQVTKLNAYKKSLSEIQGAAGQRQVDYLSRALGPQITDIAVGLATGQSPMMVLLQQGGQLRDQFALAGVAGKEMGNMLVQATKSMAVSVKDTGIAIGTAIVGGLMSAGKAFTDFAGKITGTNSIFDAFKRKLVAGGEENFKYIGTLQKVSQVFNVIAGVGIVGLVAGFVALGVALKQVIDEESAVSKSIALTGASLGLTKDRALALSETLGASKGNVGSYLNAITAIAKAGGVTSDNLKTVATTIVDVSKATGISADELAKNFSKISEKPLEALIPFAKELGAIDVATLKYIRNLEISGKYTEAAKVATEAYAKALKGASDTIKQDMGWVERFFYGIGDAAKWMWNQILNVGRSGSLDEQLQKAVNKMKELQDAGGTNVGRKDRMIAAQAKVISGILEEIDAQEKLAKSREKNSKEVSAFEKSLKNQGSANFRLPEDLYLKSLQQEYKDTVKEIDSESKKLLAQNKANYDLGLIDLGTYLGEEVRIIQNQNSEKIDSNNNYLKALDVTRQTQISAINAMVAAESGKNKTVEDSKKLEEQRVAAIASVNQAYANLTEGIKTNNEVLKDNSIEQQIKSIAHLGEQTKKIIEGSKDFIRTQDDIIAKRQLQMQIDAQLSTLSGANLVRTKAEIDMEQSHIDKLSELSKIALEAGVNLSRLRLSGLSEDDPRYQAAQQAVTAAQTKLDEARVKSREAITKAGIDAEISYYQKEWNRIQSEISDALVTALMEGGQAGSKKLRDILIAELRKPITVVVNAVVNTLFGSISGGAGSAAGSFGSSLVGSTLGNLAIGGSTLGQMGSYFATGFMNSMVGTGLQASTTAASAIGGANGMAMQAGAYAAPIAGAVGGMALNRGISSGYSTGKGMQTVQDIATVAATAFFGPLGGLAAGAISGVFNRAFGMKAKQITGEGIIGTLTAQGADVKAFEDWFQKGGWFRSNKSGRNYSAVSQGLQEYMNLALSGLSITVEKYAKILNIDSSELSSVSKSIDISLKGLSAEDRKKKIDEALGGFGEELAKKLGFESFSALEKLAQEVLAQRYDLETKLLELQGNTVALRERERAKIYESNLAIYDQIKALEDQKIAAEEQKKAAEEQKKATEELANASKSVVEEINRLRGGSTSSTNLQAEFATLTQLARSGDLSALTKLPDITRSLEQLAVSNATSAAQVVLARAGLAQSLQDTLGYLGAGNSFTSATATPLGALGTPSLSQNTAPTVTTSDLLTSLIQEVQGLRIEVRADVAANSKTSRILERVNQDGESLTVNTLA